MAEQHSVDRVHHFLVIDAITNLTQKGPRRRRPTKFAAGERYARIGQQPGGSNNDAESGGTTEVTANSRPQSSQGDHVFADDLSSAAGPHVL